MVKKLTMILSSKKTMIFKNKIKMIMSAKNSHIHTYIHISSSHKINHDIKVRWVGKNIYIQRGD
jgi:hypothetical protein